jgi:hypothetical protein
MLTGFQKAILPTDIIHTFKRVRIVTHWDEEHDDSQTLAI